MTYAIDQRLDVYIEALPDWQQAVCRELRDLIHAADPEGEAPAPSPSVARS